MKPIATLLLLALVLSPASASTFEKAEYFKNAAAGQKKGDKIQGSLIVEDYEIRFVGRKGEAEVNIPASAIRKVQYERAAKPRYAEGILIAWPLLFTKSKKHYLTVHYTDSSGASQYMLVRLHKSNFRMALAEIEARTGSTVERIEEK